MPKSENALSNIGSPIKWIILRYTTIDFYSVHFSTITLQVLGVFILPSSIANGNVKEAMVIKCHSAPVVMIGWEIGFGFKNFFNFLQLTVY